MNPHVAAAMAEVRRAREAGIEPQADTWALVLDGEDGSSETEAA